MSRKREMSESKKNLIGSFKGLTRRNKSLWSI